MSLRNHHRLLTFLWFGTII